LHYEPQDKKPNAHVDQPQAQLTSNQ